MHTGLASTFSIVGRSDDGLLGVAVTSKVLAVGAHCPFVRSGSVAISCQAYLNPYLALDVLARIDGGSDVEESCEGAWADDPSRAWRQMIAIGSEGPIFAATGIHADPWAGHRTGIDCAAAGNLLTGPEVVDAMVEAFEQRADLSLPERLLVALGSGQEAGADIRGRQSAALLVAASAAMPFVDLRVDDHEEPVRELERVYRLLSPEQLDWARTVATSSTPLPEEWIRQRQQQVRSTYGLAQLDD